MRMTKRCRAAVERLAKKKHAEGLEAVDIRNSCAWYLIARGFMTGEAARAADEVMASLEASP